MPRTVGPLCLRWTMFHPITHNQREAILTLSLLRNMCGMARYKRRFVQHIVPSLIRPPNSALQSLKHKTDIHTVFTVMELLLGTADSVIFTPGWYQDGKLLLADDRRNEILNSTVRQLRELSASTITATLGRVGSEKSR